MKVYVMTTAKPFGEERYAGVKATKKAAEKAFRQLYPHMRSDGNDSYVSDNNNQLLLFIHEEEI